jgi:uncharacterized protein (DUF924 family)
MQQRIDAILDYWFGELDADGLCREDRNKLWFQSTPSSDDTCRQLFGALVEQALAGDLELWAEGDDGLVALIVLLDQFTRNIFRGTPRAFAGDPTANRLATAAIDSGHWLQLPAIHRVFVLLPLEHSENLADQERCVALYQQLNAEYDTPQFASFARYAVAHRDVIAQFGRFPHRNAILERSSTPEELQHLEQHGGF